MTAAPFNQSPRRIVFCTTASVLAMLLSGACVMRQSRLQVIDYADDGSARRYVENFDEAYYDMDAHGNIDLILRRVHTGRMSDDQDLTQVVHIHSLWRSIPGHTIAHDDQINATVTYAILEGTTGHTFAGAGSVFFKSRKGHDVLTGSLGRAVVKLSQKTPATRPLFSRPELSGSFRAIRDPRQVKHIKNELRRLFGSSPAG